MKRRTKKDHLITSTIERDKIILKLRQRETSPYTGDTVYMPVDERRIPLDSKYFEDELRVAARELEESWELRQKAKALAAAVLGS